MKKSLLLACAAMLSTSAYAQSPQLVASPDAVAPLAASARQQRTPTPAPSFAPCTPGQEISQDTATNAYGNGDTVATGGTAQELGQSITAPCTGALDSLFIVFQPRAGTAGMPVAGEVTIYDGAGTAGTLLQTIPFAFNAPPEGFAYTFPVNTNITVTEMQAYTFFVNMTQGAINLQGSNLNPYAGGTAFVSTSGSPTPSASVATIDLRFFAVFAAAIGPVASEGGPQGRRIALGRSYPNPAAASATVPFEVREAGDIRLAVYDMLGREVAVLADRAFAAGAHTASLDAARLPAGAYVVRLSTAGEALTSRVTVVR